MEWSFESTVSAQLLIKKTKKNENFFKHLSIMWRGYTYLKLLRVTSVEYTV